MDDLSLKQFVDMDRSGHVASYVAALEAFDAIPEMQELKALARERGGFGPGKSLLDVGCGFGLETLRLARLAGPGATVAGIDKSADFVADAARRAAAAGLAIDFRTGDAAALPWPDARFDCVRAERLLIYLADWAAAVREMRRVAKPGGGLAFIEPDFSTTTVNLPDRAAVRRALAHEADTAVVESWLPGALLGLLRTSGSRGSRWRRGWRCFRRTSGRPISAASAGTPPRPGRCRWRELEAWLAGHRRAARAGAAVRDRRLLPVHGARLSRAGGAGTLSMPEPPQGWQRRMRRSASQPPLRAPWVARASSA